MVSVFHTVDMHSDAITALGASGRSGRKPHSSVGRAVLLIAVGVVVLVVALYALVLRLYTNEGGSMEPTLSNGQRFVVNRLADPEINDVVVATVASGSGTRQVVKRVVAVAGDTVAYVNCVVVRNGVQVKESFAPSSDRGGEELVQMTVPPGHVLLLGDNRGASLDSRSFGPVDVDDIDGVVAFTF
jgi:signal peptidase I